MKNFNQELNIFYNKINNGENIAITRFGDGEMMIMDNEFIDLTKKANGEFIYNSSNPDDLIYRDRLIDSYTYHNPNYFVGVACPCCVGNEKY